LKVCAVIPTYDNAATIEKVVADVRAHVAEVIVVDDGSGPEAVAAAKRIAERELAHVVFRPANGGKGAAVKTGLAEADGRGFTHALQIDADGQHHVADIPRLLAESAAHPEALVLGQPLFDASAPRGRRIARQISVFWCAVEALGYARIGDPLCGFRVYPVKAALLAKARGDAMDFDPEIAVRLAWQGLPIRHVTTEVRYLGRAEGGVSHYRFWSDTALISWMHTRLVVRGVLQRLGWKTKRLP
jgi:glycosyltransferase involved in cell wall biosynthesis